MSNDVSLEIYDSSGKVINKGVLNGSEYNVSALSPGLYFMTITENDEVIDRVKFMKK